MVHYLCKIPTIEHFCSYFSARREPWCEFPGNCQVDRTEVECVVSRRKGKIRRINDSRCQQVQSHSIEYTISKRRIIICPQLTTIENNNENILPRWDKNSQDICAKNTLWPFYRMLCRYKEQVSFFKGDSSAQPAKRRRTDEVRIKLVLIPTEHLSCVSDHSFGAFSRQTILQGVSIRRHVTTMNKSNSNQGNENTSMPKRQIIPVPFSMKQLRNFYAKGFRSTYVCRLLTWETGINKIFFALFLKSMPPVNG